MKKRWWLGGGAAVVALAGMAVALGTGLVKLPGFGAAAGDKSSHSASGKPGDKSGDNKPDVPLEFVPREVVQPILARMPGLVEFSGPLVAPQTALVRAKASTR